MELEDIKNIWNKQVTDDHRSEEELDQILKSKSRNPLGRIYRNMLLELLILLILIIGIGASEYFSGEKVHFVSYAIILILSSVLYWIYYRKIRVDQAKDSFKQTIFKLNRLFRLYKAYLNLCIYGMPVGFIIGIFIRMEEVSDIPTDPVYWITMTAIAGLTLLLAKPIRWLAHLFYGRHVNNLKDLVTEIKELESGKAQ